MEILQSLMPFITNGGVPVILFVIWYFTFTRANTQYDSAIKHTNDTFTKASEESRRLFEIALAETRNKNSDALKHANELFRESQARNEKQLAEANTRHEKLLNELVQIQKEEVKAKELLVGLLASMKTTLEAR